MSLPAGDPSPPDPGADAPRARASDRFLPLGLVLGTLCWVVVFLVSFLLLNRSLNSGPATLIIALVWGAVAAGLLASPKTRRTGSGLLLGLAVSFVVWAGVCAAMGATLW